MTDDLLARLRAADIGICDEAADEIDRLRWHEEAAAEALAANEALGAEVMRLRAEPVFPWNELIGMTNDQGERAMVLGHSAIHDAIVAVLRELRKEQNDG